MLVYAAEKKVCSTLSRKLHYTRLLAGKEEASMPTLEELKERRQAVKTQKG